MKKLVEAFRNIFSTPDLRNRVLFTLGLLGVYRLGAFIPTPGINTDLLQQLFEQSRGSVLGIIDLFSGGNFRRLTIFALGHHAVHHCVDHSAVAGGGMALSRAFAKRRRTRPAQDHAIYALPDDYLERISIVYDRPYADPAEPCRTSAGLQPRLAIHPDDHADADHRLGFHHVAWRADQRSRHWQRHVADHFRGYRGGLAARGRRPVGQSQDATVGLVHSDCLAGLVGSDGRGHRLHCVSSRADKGAFRCSTPSV